MREWLRLIFGAVASGAIWAGVWAAVGALIGALDSAGRLAAVWVGPAIGAHPGFVGGAIFFGALGIAARPHRFVELSLSAVVVCGVMVGLVLGMLPLAINKPPGNAPLWVVAAAVIGSMTVMSTVSAAGSLMLARAVWPRGEEARSAR